MTFLRNCFVFRRKIKRHSPSFYFQYSSDSESERSLNLPHVLPLSGTEKDPLLLNIDRYKDDCYLKHIFKVGRSVCLSVS